MRAIWLASYPKSGNTWMRMLLAALSLDEGDELDINDLPERGGIASGRGPFDHFSLIDSGLLTHGEIELVRPRIHEVLVGSWSEVEDEPAPGAAPVRFVKVHDAYTRTPSGEPLLAGARGAHAAVVIVRDPRDVVPSFANHSRTSLDAAIAFLNNSASAFCGRIDRQKNQLRQRLLSWSGHVESWLDQRDLPVHLVRYEDLSAHTAATLRGVLAFAGCVADEARLARAVQMAAFERLRAQERETGFREGPQPYPEGRFFRRGQAGAWRDELTEAQVARIEAAHSAVMSRLGYELAYPPASAQAQTGGVA